MKEGENMNEIKNEIFRGMLYLEHYGVKGQKWGVRRSSSALGSAAKARKKAGEDSDSSGGSGGSGGSGSAKKAPSDRKAAKAARKSAKEAEKAEQGSQKKSKGGKDDIKGDDDKTRYKTSSKKLTNDELNTRIKRMETEKRYNDLNKRDISTGQKMAVDVLKTAGTDTAKKVLSGTAAYGVKLGIAKQFGNDTANAILPKVKTNRTKDKKPKDE